MTLFNHLSSRELSGVTSSDLVDGLQRKWYSKFCRQKTNFKPTKFDGVDGRSSSYISSVASSTDGALTCLASTRGRIEIHESAAVIEGQDSLRMHIERDLPSKAYLDNVLWGREGRDELLVSDKNIYGIYGFNLETCDSSWRPTWKWMSDDHVHDMIMQGENCFVGCLKKGEVFRYDWRDGRPAAVCSIKDVRGKSNLVMCHSGPYLVSGFQGIIAVYDSRKSDQCLLRKRLFDGKAGGAFTLLKHFPGTQTCFAYKNEEENLGYVDISTGKSRAFRSSLKRPRIQLKEAEFEMTDYRRLLNTRRDDWRGAWYISRRRGSILQQPFGGGWRIFTPGVKNTGLDVNFLSPASLSLAEDCAPSNVFLPTDHDVVVVDVHSTRSSIIVGMDKNRVDIFDEANHKK